jgi:hypothetical protein
MQNHAPGQIPKETSLNAVEQVKEKVHHTYASQSV